MQRSVSRQAVVTATEACVSAARGEVQQRPLERGVTRPDAKFLREETGQRRVAQRHQTGCASMTADGDLRLETRPLGSKTDDEFLLVSRQGRGISDELRGRLLAVLHPPNKPGRRPHGATTKD